MPQNKYKLPEPVKTACIAYVRDYKRLLYEYNQKRDIVLNAQKNVSFGSPSGGSGGNSEPHSKTIKLDDIENHLDTKIMRAVERAKLLIGDDICDDGERGKLREAMIDCCKDGRRFIFRYYGLDMDKSTFYRRRSKFLYEIAKNLKEN